MRINHVTLLVADRGKAEEFYAGVLGLEKEERSGHLWIKVGEQYVHLTENSGPVAGDSFYHFAIEIENLPGYLEQIGCRGAEVFDVALERTQGFVRDPDGNLIEFIDEKNNFFK